MYLNNPIVKTLLMKLRLGNFFHLFSECQINERNKREKVDPFSEIYIINF